MGKIKWRFRHILKDGRILQPSEKLPITEESLEAFRQYGEVALEAVSQEQATFDYHCLEYIPRQRRQVAVKTARMEPLIRGEKCTNDRKRGIREPNVHETDGFLS